jgi:hypothetical protein
VILVNDLAMADNTNCPQVKECAKFCLDAASGGGDVSMRKKIDAVVQPKIQQGEKRFEVILLDMSSTDLTPSYCAISC